MSLFKIVENSIKITNKISKFDNLESSFGISPLNWLLDKYLLYFNNEEYLAEYSILLDYNQQSITYKCFKFANLESSFGISPTLICLKLKSFCNNKYLKIKHKTNL